MESDEKEVDWDGLRRFYDAVEEQGGAAERAVVRAIRVRGGKMRRKFIDLESRNFAGKCSRKTIEVSKTTKAW